MRHLALEAGSCSGWGRVGAWPSVSIGCSPCTLGSACSGLQLVLLPSPRNSAVFGATEDPGLGAHQYTHDQGSPCVGTDDKTFANKEEVAGWSVGNLSIDGLSQPSLWPPHVQVLSLPCAAEVCIRQPCKLSYENEMAFGS